MRYTHLGTDATPDEIRAELARLGALKRQARYPIVQGWVMGDVDLLLDLLLVRTADDVSAAT